MAAYYLSPIGMSQFNITSSGNSGNIDYTISVSYTHLDVYKRQFNDLMKEFEKTYDIQTVSYTHLDVYKRQCENKIIVVCGVMQVLLYRAYF